mmetsp:Transcript_9199/g.18086  ORF Transcript_9199/g.18086 Transcript_9199/m.18086 type:complete len:95 (+) Transcript_9199:94-378(+)
MKEGCPLDTILSIGSFKTMVYSLQCFNLDKHQFYGNATFTLGLGEQSASKLLMKFYSKEIGPSFRARVAAEQTRHLLLITQMTMEMTKRKYGKK